jgi:WD40 repeat protein
LCFVLCALCSVDIINTSSFGYTKEMAAAESCFPCLIDEKSLDIVAIAWNSTGTALAASSCDNTIRVWDVLSGQCTSIHTPRSDESMVAGSVLVSWNPKQDQNHLLAYTAGKAVEVLDVKTKGATAMKLKEHADDVRCIKWSPDGVGLASVSKGQVKIWDTKTGTTRVVFWLENTIFIHG